MDNDDNETRLDETFSYEKRQLKRQAIKNLQELAKKLGYPPSSYEYSRNCKKPSYQTISTYFFGWDKALLAAGLNPLDKNRGEKYGK